ncbi:MAG: hypothetical protein HYS07_08375 [Chlamydiae bacterium]|nr:hypothetical protein [Chlamydiota bacterium]
MGPLQGVLEEELRNSLYLKRSYERALSKLPKGSLVEKKIKGHRYVYLVYREKGRVRFKYLGKANSIDLEKYREDKIYRAKYRKLLSQVGRQIRFLRKALRAKETA